MRFTCLGSGSRGNATLVQAGQTLVMVDCGFGIAETGRRLARAGVDFSDLAGILVTHEHADHIGGVVRVARKHRLPVWATPGTFTLLNGGGLDNVNLFNVHEPFAIDGLAVEPVTVPHDAREPSQFVFSDGALKLGILTDAGHVTPHIQRSYADLDGLILETNHDSEMLANGEYPQRLKARVGGSLGHLSNAQAADLMRVLGQGRLQHLVAAHLSEQNNAPSLARASLADALDCTQDWIHVADQQAGLDWLELR
ncbi:MAG: MBL fold metallo-hydrolase [Gammaproteobacteria bacterium]